VVDLTPETGILRRGNEMTAYAIRRLLLIIPTFFIVTLLVFLSVRFIPGNVVDDMIARMGSSGSISTAGTRAAIEHALGLDVPIYVQYFRWLGVAPQQTGGLHGLLEGDLGTSLWNSQNVTERIKESLPVSVELGIIAFLTAILLAIPIGVYSAIRQDTIGDYLGRSISIIFISVPAFWIGTMVWIYPSIWWNWTPAIEYIPFFKNPGGNLVQFLIPGFIVGMIMGGTLMRMTRTMMLEVLRQDYIRTAWAKGLRENTVIIRHALKNALIPVVTIIGVMVPMLIAGEVVIEQIFVLPGIGQLTYNSIMMRDYPLISGLNVLIAVLILVVNLLVDLAYAWLDPRVQYR
jgi:peptide/nickel transport system permease protein